MKEKIILDLCGRTGSWSRPYKENGYDVRVITLPEYDLLERTDFEGDNIVFTRRDGTKENIIAREVYGILAPPTCTMFSLARTTAKTPRDLAGAMELVERCLRIIWFCREKDGPLLKFWALENPMGLLRQFIGRPLYTFSPEQFGESYTKKTDLWGYFNIPSGTPRKQTEEERLCSIRNNRVLPELPEGYEMPEGWSRQAARRSMTSSKFAEAFYRANK